MRPFGLGAHQSAVPLIVLAKQLAFDFTAASRATFDNFVVGRNAELVARLRALRTAPAGERFLYLWGAAASGRSHLLHATVEHLQAADVRAAYVRADGVVDSLHALDAVAVDDVERLDEVGQVALFNLYNALRESGGTLIAAGPVAPMQLDMRADVMTRLGWGLVYEVHGLTDADKAEALAEHAAARGFSLPPDVSHYLLTHGRRDMPALLATLDALDRRSLESKRPVTVPLLRELLASRA
jgi:DnaA family protein